MILMTYYNVTYIFGVTNSPSEIETETSYDPRY